MADPFLSTETTRLIGMMLCGFSGGCFFASAFADGQVRFFRIGCALAVLGLAFLLRSMSAP